MSFSWHLGNLPVSWYMEESGLWFQMIRFLYITNSSCVWLPFEWNSWGAKIEGTLIFFSGKLVCMTLATDPFNPFHLYFDPNLTIHKLEARTCSLTSLTYSFLTFKTGNKNPCFSGWCGLLSKSPMEDHKGRAPDHGIKPVITLVTSWQHKLKL